MPEVELFQTITLRHWSASQTFLSHSESHPISASPKTTDGKAMVEINWFPWTGHNHRFRIYRKWRNGICFTWRRHFRIRNIVVLFPRHIAQRHASVRLCQIHAAIRRTPNAELGDVARSTGVVSARTAFHHCDLSAFSAGLALTIGGFANFLDPRFGR